MKRWNQVWLYAAAVVLCASSFAGAQTVKVNWRVKAPFGDYKTFALAKNQQDDFFTQFVPKYVTSALESKGLNPAAGSQQPDVKVAYHFKTQDVVDATTTSDGFGWGMGGMGMGMGDGMATTREQPRTIGILTIDLVDTRTNQVVWRGQATEDSVAGNQKGDEKQVWKSVGKMFDHFPPKPAKKG